MSAESWAMLFHLGMAWLAGSLIGLERTFHSRPAGFRTHALVCVASALLMMVTVYQWEWLGDNVPESTIRTDPTRMAQGIMTGIGFLGAGVIFKEGLSVHGLTTAASIWITSALGILFGIGFLFPAVLATVITLLTLSLFRLLEARVPSQVYAHCVLRFDIARVMTEEEVRKLIADYHFSVVSMTYRTREDGRRFEYRMMLLTNHRNRIPPFAAYLRDHGMLQEFHLAPAGE